jgi:hypothetical protein
MRATTKIRVDAIVVVKTPTRFGEFKRFEWIVPINYTLAYYLGGECHKNVPDEVHRGAAHSNQNPMPAIEETHG